MKSKKILHHFESILQYPEDFIHNKILFNAYSKRTDGPTHAFHTKFLVSNSQYEVKIDKSFLNEISGRNLVADDPFILSKFNNGVFLTLDAYLITL